MENDKSARYRERAKQLRSVAADLENQTAKKVLLATAEDYEAMALEAERIAAAKPKSDPPRDI
jgi:hypothetical protein